MADSKMTLSGNGLCFIALLLKMAANQEMRHRSSLVYGTCKYVLGKVAGCEKNQILALASLG